MFKHKEIVFMLAIQNLDDYFYIYNPVGHNVFFCYGEGKKLFLRGLSQLMWQGPDIQNIVKNYINNN